MLRLHAVRKIIHAHPWTRTSLRRTNLHAQACTWHVTAMRARGRRLPSYPNTPMVMRPRAHPGAMALCNRCRGSPRRPTGPRHTCYANRGGETCTRRGGSIKGAAGHLLPFLNVDRAAGHCSGTVGGDFWRSLCMLCDHGHFSFVRLAFDHEIVFVKR